MSNQFVASFAFEAMWTKIVPWFGDNILNLRKTIVVETSGSGDGMYNYICVLLFALLALVGALIWSIIDRNRLNYEKLLNWLLVLIRYYLIFQMVTYGLAKLFYMQFQPPRFARLIQAYGDSSPMGLLWTFMGFSKGYTIFTGAAELLGGVLLLFRRTRTLGALVTFGVMVNVMALNFFYDVPVKLLSTHLVLLALFLLVLDGKRLLKFFIFNGTVEPRKIRPLFSNPKLEIGKNVMKWLVILGGGGFLFYQTYSMLDKWGPDAPKPELYGLYETETFEKNGEEQPPLITDYNRWHWLAIDWKDRAMIQSMTGTKLHLNFIPDTSNHSIVVYSRQDTTLKYTFSYAKLDSAQLQLEGVYQNDTLKILMNKKEKKDFLLNSRKFNWVNESPFNR